MRNARVCTSKYGCKGRNPSGKNHKRDLISLRTKEALASKKAQGVVLGKPKGTVQKSKFDKDAHKIMELLGLGLSVRKIAIFLGYTNHIGLNTYIRKRQLRPVVD